MELQKINQILQDTAYIRTSGTAEELKCAQYLQAQCEEMGLNAKLEAFPVAMSKIEQAMLLADGKEIPCKGYLCAGDADLEAPLYYLRDLTPASLSGCKGKIVLIDGYLRYWLYRDLLENGALGFISYSGDVHYADDDIDQRELRAAVHQGTRIPGVNLNAKQAVELIRSDVSNVRILLKQKETMGESHNVIAELPGETDEWIVCTAHYDSTSLSQGAYDNMSGSIGLLDIAEHFLQHPHRYGLRLIWCGSEERGLLGSKAYTATHEDELKKIVLNVNLDMIGCIMGGFIACCTSEEKLVHYLEYLACTEGFPMKARQGVYSSDSTPFADHGVPSLTFARIAPDETATIHNRYDTLAVMKAEQQRDDMIFVNSFIEKMVNAKPCPVSREIPENMKLELDYYLFRKRKPQ